MEKKIEEAIDKLVKMGWISLNKNVRKEAIVVVIQEFILETPIKDFWKLLRNIG